MQQNTTEQWCIEKYERGARRCTFPMYIFKRVYGVCPLNMPLVQTLFALMAYSASQNYNFCSNFRQNFLTLNSKRPGARPLPKYVTASELCDLETLGKLIQFLRCKTMTHNISRHHTAIDKHNFHHIMHSMCN